MRTFISAVIILVWHVCLADSLEIESVYRMFSKEVLESSSRINISGAQEYQAFFNMLKTDKNFPEREQFVEIALQGFEDFTSPLILDKDDAELLRSNMRIMSDRSEFFVNVFSAMDEISEKPEFQLRIAKKLGEIEPIIRLPEDTRVPKHSYLKGIKAFRFMIIRACAKRQIPLKRKMGYTQYGEFKKEFVKLGKLDDAECELLDKKMYHTLRK